MKLSFAGLAFVGLIAGLSNGCDVISKESHGEGDGPDQVTHAEQSAGGALSSALDQTARLSQDASATALAQGKLRLQQFQTKIGELKVPTQRELQQLSALKDEISRIDAMQKIKEVQADLDQKTKEMESLKAKVDGAVTETKSKVADAQRAYDDLKSKLGEAQKTYESAADRVHKATESLPFP